MNARRRRQQGFTLLEVLLAFALFALVFATALQTLAGSSRNARLARDFTQAALHAQTLMDRVGITEALEEGNTSGEFDERFRWNLEITPFEIPTAADSGAGLFQPVDVFRVRAVVRWDETREAEFVSLRLRQKEVRPQ